MSFLFCGICAPNLAEAAGENRIPSFLDFDYIKRSPIAFVAPYILHGVRLPPTHVKMNTLTIPVVYRCLCSLLVPGDYGVTVVLQNFSVGYLFPFVILNEGMTCKTSFHLRIRAMRNYPVPVNFQGKNLDVVT